MLESPKRERKHPKAIKQNPNQSQNPNRDGKVRDENREKKASEASEKLKSAPKTDGHRSAAKEIEKARGGITHQIAHWEIGALEVGKKVLGVAENDTLHAHVNE